jgi:phage N-6-adenine-methyltransferase
LTNFGELAISGTDVWLTPPELLSKLGNFELDPCAPLNRPWNTATNHFTIEDDGLKQDWQGRVWLNPPYGRGMERWLGKLANHAEGGIALVFARTETKTFFDTVWGRADAIFFIKGRIRFHLPSGERAGTATSPSVLIAYGEINKEILRNLEIEGFFIDLKTS